jgi:hypothetical protein
MEATIKQVSKIRKKFGQFHTGRPASTNLAALTGTGRKIPEIIHPAIAP